MTLTTSAMVDGGILLILAVSILIGILRGATREVLGIAGWAGAFATVFYGLPLCRPLGRQYIHTPMVADAVTAGLLFVLSLAVFIIISRLLSSCIKGGLLGGLDRSLGLVFGCLRGALIVCLLYLGMAFFYAPQPIPSAIQTARFMPWVKVGAEQVATLIPKDYLPQDRPLHALTTPSGSELLNNHFATVEEAVKQLSTLKPTSPQKPKSVDALLEAYDTSPQE